MLASKASLRSEGASRCCATVARVAKTTAKPTSKSTPTPEGNGGTEKIYIGQGRFIEDKPERYPDKDGLGVGGWAGGEAGLWQFRDQIVREDGYPYEPRAERLARAPTTGTMVIRGDKLDGDELVYIGQGNYLKDDPRKYAGKESAGFLTGATGGFSGGEVGVQQFTKAGKLNLADPATVKKRQLTKDAITIGALFALSAVSVYLLQENGFIDLTPAQTAIEGALDGSASSPLAGPQGGELGNPSRAPAAPLVSPEQVAALEIVGVSVGVVLLGLGVKKGVTVAGGLVREGIKQNGARVVVLAAAGAIAYKLLIESP